MPRLLCAFLVIGLLIAPTLSIGQSQTPPQPKIPTTAVEWQALALTDVNAMEALLREHTPIPLDTENKSLGEWLAKGADEARRRAANVKTEADWYYTLAAFANGFRDPHINVSPTRDLPGVKWPGFVAAAKGSGAVVVWRDDTDATVPAVGAEIIACDGKSLSALADERVFPFVLNPSLPTDRRRAVSRLFIYRETSVSLPPSECVIKAGATSSTVKLQWRIVPQEKEALANWSQRYNAAHSGPTTSFSVSEPAPGVTWISVPSFQSAGDNAPRLEALIAEVVKRGDAMRRGKAIVIDTRGNGGGNSAWANKLAEAIFTPEVLKRHRAPNINAEGVDWRASTGNIAYWQEWEQKMVKEFGAFSGSRLFAQNIHTSMQQALDQGKQLYREGSEKNRPSGGATQKRPRNQASPFPARVYFLSNGSCGSSCLNFADQVLFVPGVQLIGSATSGDGMLMDVRSETLPSALARLTFPQKVARGRGRGNLEFYAADVPYDGLWDDDSVRRWVLELVRKDAGAG